MPHARRTPRAIRVTPRFADPQPEQGIWYHVLLCLEECPTQISFAERDYGRIEYANVALRTMPRWNDRLIINGHTYRVTSVDRVTVPGKPAVNGIIEHCHQPPAQERAQLEASVACVDCGIDVRDDMFMVNNELWAKVMDGQQGAMICRPCFQHRLGRALRHDDLTDAPINFMT